MTGTRARWRWNAGSSWQLTLPLPGVRRYRYELTHVSFLRPPAPANDVLPWSSGE